MATIRGTNGPNRLLGTALPDSIFGLGNNDFLFGLGGNDTNLDGGTGNDTIDGGTGKDTMKGGAGNDTYLVDNALDKAIEGVNKGSDTVKSTVTFTLGANVEKLILTGAAAINGTGNALSNVITGNSQNNILNGGLGNDTLSGGNGKDTISFASMSAAFSFTLGAGGSGMAAVQGTDTYSSIENVLGGAGSDLIIGNAGVNILSGGGGDDAFDGGGGNDTVNGGGGFDGLSYYNSGTAVTFTLPQSGNGTINTGLGIVTFTSIENIAGSNFDNDTLTGNDGVNVFFGHGGDDVLNGGDGSDTMNGGDDNDLLFVSSDAGGSDTDTLNGDSGTDTISFELAGDGPSGGLTFSFTLGSGLFNTPNGFGIASVGYTGIENVTGRNNINFGDILTGDNGSNVLNGLAGNDILQGGGGLVDVLNGGDGNDTLIVSIGATNADQANLNGNNGSDTLSFELGLNGIFGDTSFTFTLDETGSGTLPINFIGLTFFSYTSIENLTGRDVATVTDTLNGNSGNNVLSGLSGNDFLFGGGGSDSLLGGNGNDYLEGGIGKDTLDGGTGDDTFAFAGNTGLLDFTDTDVINNYQKVAGIGGDNIALQDGAFGTYAWQKSESAGDTYFEYVHQTTFDVVSTVIVVGVIGLVLGDDYTIF